MHTGELRDYLRLLAKGEGHYSHLEGTSEEDAVAAIEQARLSILSREQEIRLLNERLAFLEAIGFEVDGFARRMILDGTDELGYLLNLEPQLAAYEAAHPPRVSTLHAE